MLIHLIPFLDKCMVCDSDGVLLVMLQMLSYRILSSVDTDNLDADFQLLD